ncbi:uncharacterized protein LOC132306050 [Cornus florida]|uniref:uncharacterized protein LOC132306050 n=1 Tax=Cornus florida TaxID=4283 RepID=UPI0028A1087E|nr:uncharacterized protein LOC132306050 [Cornus florida]
MDGDFYRRSIDDGLLFQYISKFKRLKIIAEFLERHIFHGFGLPETIIVDNGSVFRGSEVLQLGHNMQELEENKSGTTPYQLTFGYDAVLSMELNVKSVRVALQHNLIPIDYNEAMLAELEDLDKVKKLALDHFMVHKAKVMKAYSKIVKFKSFEEADMVWQTILPPRKVDRTYGKWSPTWKGPYLFHQVLHGGAYKLKDLDGDIHEWPINGSSIRPFLAAVDLSGEITDHSRASTIVSCRLSVVNQLPVN